MATDTITGPAILGGTTRTRVFKNFIDGEWVAHRELHVAVREEEP